VRHVHGSGRENRIACSPQAHFDLSELHQLWFDLGIDYEELAGQRKSDAARELIVYAERHGRIDVLLARCREPRPNATWPAVEQLPGLPSSERPSLAEMPTDRVSEVAPLPPGSRMLLRANPLFVGRADDLTALATALKGGTTTVIAAATGMGGIGNTRPTY
jgi:hypothetical protein